MHPYALEICEPVKTWVERSVVPHVQLVLKILPHIVFLIKFGRKWIKNYVLFLFIRFFFLKYINLQKSKIWQTYLKITYLAWIPFHGHRISLAQWTAAVHLYHTSHLTGCNKLSLWFSNMLPCSRNSCRGIIFNEAIMLSILTDL